MKIIIPGDPVPQARMKHSNRGGFVRTYDPKAKEKENIRKLLISANLVDDFTHPRISFIFYMAIPKSIRKRDVKLYNSGKLKHDKKPDVDNLIKLYLDCLDGIAIHGDQKVSLGPCIKLYHPEPKTVIWINETAQKIQPWELDVAFQDVSECDIPSFSVSDYPFGSYTLFEQVSSLFQSIPNPLDEVEPLPIPAHLPWHQGSKDMVSQMKGISPSEFGA